MEGQQELDETQNDLSVRRRPPRRPNEQPIISADWGSPFNRSWAAVAACQLPATDGSRPAAPSWADDPGCLAAWAGPPWIAGGRSGRGSGPGRGRRRVPAAGRTPGPGYGNGGG